MRGLRGELVKHRPRCDFHYCRRPLPVPDPRPVRPIVDVGICDDCCAELDALRPAQEPTP